MTDQLIVRDEILIQATPARVWEILIKPKYVAQWDELPEEYPTDDMTVGSKVIWENPEGGETVTTIIKAEENKELVIALAISRWELQPKLGEVAYQYKLEERDRGTLLQIEIGDFALIENGQDYYDASIEFAKESKKVIKELAEGEV